MPMRKFSASTLRPGSIWHLNMHPALLITEVRADQECSRRDVTVCEVPGSNANTVAEHTFALILALSRRIIASRKLKKEARFFFEWWRGFELEDKTLGVIGTGRIGRRVIHIALAFGMKVLAYDPYQQTDMAEGVRYVPLNECCVSRTSSRCIRP